MNQEKNYFLAFCVVGVMAAGTACYVSYDDESASSCRKTVAFTSSVCTQKIALKSSGGVLKSLEDTFRVVDAKLNEAMRLCKKRFSSKVKEIEGAYRAAAGKLAMLSSQVKERVEAENSLS